MNRILLLILCLYFAFFTAAYAGEIYTYTDKDGNTVVSNTPIPEKYEKKAKKIESYKRDSPEAIERYEMQRKANIQRQEAATRQIHQSNQAQREAQASTGKSRVELEKKRLENAKKTTSPSKEFNEEKRRSIEAGLKKLEKDPDQYFYDQEQNRKAAAAHPVVIINR